MDDEGEAALAAVASGPQQPGFELGVLEELSEGVGRELGTGGQGRRDDRLVHRRHDHEFERLWSDVDDELCRSHFMNVKGLRCSCMLT